MLALCIALLVATVFFVPLGFQLKAWIGIVPDVKLVVTFGLGRCRLYKACGVLSPRGFLLRSGRKKVRKVTLATEWKRKNTLASNLDNGVFSILDLKSLKIVTKVGVENDPAKAVLSGHVWKELVRVFARVLQNGYDAFIFENRVQTCFGKDLLRLAATLRVRISLAQIVYAFFYALHRKIVRRKGAKYGKSIQLVTSH